jgi:hypothetical protein
MRIDLSTLIEIHSRAYRIKPDARSLRLKKWRFANKSKREPYPLLYPLINKNLRTIREEFIKGSSLIILIKRYIHFFIYLRAVVVKSLGLEK